MIRYPLAPLAHLEGSTVPELLRCSGVSGSTAKEYRDLGVSERVADRLAVLHGYHPAVVWPEWLTDSINQASARCSCGDLFVPARASQRFCSPRCRTREKMRRYRRDPDVQARNRARVSAHYAATADYQRAARRQRYAAAKDDVAIATRGVVESTGSNEEETV